MIHARLVQKYKCDFCKHRPMMRWAMEKHERRCFKNPNRICDACQNTGTIVYLEVRNEGYTAETERPCEYCAKKEKYEALG